jgi:hypothetical protein
MSVDRMRTYEEAPWISLLTSDERAALEVLEADPEAEEWDALVAADRGLEDDLMRPSRSSRLLVPLAVGGLLAAVLLALGPSGATGPARGAGASSATDSGEVAAVTEVPERNRAVVASSTSRANTGWWRWRWWRWRWRRRRWWRRRWLDLGSGHRGALRRGSAGHGAARPGPRRAASAGAGSSHLAPARSNTADSGPAAPAAAAPASRPAVTRAPDQGRRRSKKTASGGESGRPG